MKKLSWLLSMVLIFTFLTACSDAIPNHKVITEENAIQEKQTVNKEVVVVENKKEEKEDSKEQLEENIKQTQEDEITKEAKEEKEEKVIIIQEEKETSNENIANNITNKTLIASGETNFNPNQIERSSNIRLAASYINGLILKPGDEFSFNKVVGRRTKERGFLPADIFVGQSVTKGYGGGVCQTSSTICTAVRKTELKILEQNPHSQRVTYTTIDNEAMINYGTSDFRFVNTYLKPVLIEICFMQSGDREIIRCDIYLLG